ncbi:protein kinase [Nocardioidaceae bacterium]|nr:protein kinase [Nocardioidaceae bacterium]
MSVSVDDRPGAGSGPRRTHVGPWRLQSCIGEGGMGVVHLASAADGRRVALKVLRPHVVSDTESRERLAREVALLGRVDSPRVAAVLDADPWHEVPWVATRYVPGWSLHEHVRAEGPLTGRDLRWFARCLAEALSVVHAAGVVHRDVKPANVLMEGRSPVLIDFGLARLADDSRLTQAGFLMGTPGYLAPEVLTGDEATPAADVHAFGACLAYAATGRAPFGSGPAVAVMDRVRRAEHDLSEVDPGLRPMVQACLDPDPARRPSAQTLFTALAAIPDTDAAAYAPVRAPQQATAASTRPVPEPDPTMPLVVGAAAVRSGRLTSLLRGPATALTRRLGDAAPTRRETVVAPAAPPLTRRLPVEPRPEQAPVAPAAPSTPRDRAGAYAPGPSPAPGRRSEDPGALVGSLRVGLLAVAVTAFLAAPWVALGVVLVAAHALRTWSWTSQARREKVWRRGRSRWYDGPAALLVSPWFALVALGGTAVLGVWVAAVVAVVGTGAVVLGAPVQGGLVLAGAALAVAVTRGPGARRVRHPLDRAVRQVARSRATALTVVCVLALATALLAFGAAPGPDWAPFGSPRAWVR